MEADVMVSMVDVVDVVAGMAVMLGTAVHGAGAERAAATQSEVAAEVSAAAAQQRSRSSLRILEYQRRLPNRAPPLPHPHRH